MLLPVCLRPLCPLCSECIDPSIIADTSDASLRLEHAICLLSMSMFLQDIAPDVIGQEIISREVMNFMNMHGSVKEEDLSKLESYVKSMLIGEEPKKQFISQRRNNVDEWSLITKYEAEKTSEEEKIRREKLISQRRRIKGELDAQVDDQRRRELRVKQEEALWGKQEEKAVDEWKASEQVRPSVSPSRLHAVIRLALSARSARYRLLVIRAQRRHYWRGCGFGKTVVVLQR